MADTTGKTIDEVTPDTSIGGAEKIPVSDAGTAKSITTQLMKQYVVDAIGAITSARSVDLDYDKIFIGAKNGAKYDLKPINGSTLCDAVYALMFGKDAVSTFSTSDKVAVQNGGATKTTTLGALADYIVENKSLTFNIHGLPSNQTDLVDADEIAYSHNTSGSTWTTLKKTLANLKNYVLSKLDSYAGSATTLSNVDNLICTTSQGAVKKISVSNIAVGSGDIKGPELSDITDNKIPQWDKGATEQNKKLKAGLIVAAGSDPDPATHYSTSTTITSTSSDSEIPTARNVYLFFDKNVKAPDSSTATEIPWFADDTGKSIAGSGTYILESSTNDTTITSLSGDDDLPTARNVWLLTNKRVLCVKPEGTQATGKIPQFSDEDGTTAGPNFSVSASSSDATTISSTSTDDELTTAKNVYLATANKISCSSGTTTANYIPQWEDAVGKQLKGGLEVSSSSNGETTIGASSTDSQLATAKNVHCALSSSLSTLAPESLTLKTYWDSTELPNIEDSNIKNGQICCISDTNGITLCVAHKPPSISSANYHWIAFISTSPV